jgi:hypothetical protein
MGNTRAFKWEIEPSPSKLKLLLAPSTSRRCNLVKPCARSIVGGCPDNLLLLVLLGYLLTGRRPHDIASQFHPNYPNGAIALKL